MSHLSLLLAYKWEGADTVPQGVVKKQYAEVVNDFWAYKLV